MASCSCGMFKIIGILEVYCKRVRRKDELNSDFDYIKQIIGFGCVIIGFKLFSSFVQKSIQ